MIIADLPHLLTISDSDLDEIKGGKTNNYYDNKAAALALAKADGFNIFAVAGTLVYLGPGISKAQSFSVAKSLSEN